MGGFGGGDLKEWVDGVASEAGDDLFLSVLQSSNSVRVVDFY